MVQGEDGWRTPEDTWMNLEEAEGEVFFLNVLHGKEPDSDEETEREIKKTEAAVDACILRRAKRAGVSVAGPEGRHMSKAERDLICGMIGDEPGAWAKRRKEIEEMSEEDMQAEIERTEVTMIERVKPATRRRQGLSMRKLPVTMMILNLVGMQGRPVEALTAYDCSNRSNIVESYLLLEPDAGNN
jgi:hypothetical protein